MYNLKQKQKKVFIEKSDLQSIMQLVEKGHNETTLKNHNE